MFDTRLAKMSWKIPTRYSDKKKYFKKNVVKSIHFILRCNFIGTMMLALLILAHIPLRIPYHMKRFLQSKHATRMHH